MISGAANLTNNIIHFIPDTYQYTVLSSPGLTPTNVFTQCDSNMCASEKINTPGTPLAGVTFTKLSSNTDVQVQTTQNTLNGFTHDVFYRALWPLGTYTNCVLFNKIMSITFKYVTITPVAIANINYNIG
jgi:hypothetical protein